MAEPIATTTAFVLTGCVRGLFGRTRLVSAKNFFVRNNDLQITVNYSGYVNIDERRYDRRDRGWDNNDRDRDRNDDRDYRSRGNF